MSRTDSVDAMLADYVEELVPPGMPPEALQWIRASYLAGASASLRVLAERTGPRPGDMQAQVMPLAREILGSIQAMQCPAGSTH